MEEEEVEEVLNKFISIRVLYGKIAMTDEELKKLQLAIKIVLEELDNYKKNSINKQVIIDKMEKLNKEIKNADAIEAVFMIKQQQTLDELLEEVRDKQ